MNIRELNGKTLFEVGNRGKGIPPIYRKRIFGKYFSASPQQPAIKSGAGLGLYFCKLAVEAHGGTIGFESEPDKETRFYFSLPGAKR